MDINEEQVTTVEVEEVSKKNKWLDKFKKKGKQQMKQKNTLYKAYLDKKKETKIKNKMIEKYNISNDDNTIIINKNNNKFFLFILDVISKIIKLIFYAVICILVTIGATVVLNKELLDYIINFIK